MDAPPTPSVRTGSRVAHTLALVLVLAFAAALAACEPDAAPVDAATDAADGTDASGEDTTPADAADAGTTDGGRDTDTDTPPPDTVDDTATDTPPSDTPADTPGDTTTDAPDSTDTIDPDAPADTDGSVDTEDAADTDIPRGPVRISASVDLRTAERYGIAIDSMDLSTLTHLTVGYGNVSPPGTCTVGAEGDDVTLRALGETPGVRVLLSVGGFIGSQFFSSIAADPDLRSEFVASCVGLVTDLGLDGLEIAWQYPIAGGIAENETSPEDWANFVLLLQDVRAGLDAEEGDLELGFVGPADLYVVPPEDLAAATAVVDQVALVTYDFYGPWARDTGFVAALFRWIEGFGFSVNLIVDAYRAAGVDMSRLLVSLPLYGWGWAGVPDIDDGLFQTSTGFAPGSGPNDGVYPISVISAGLGDSFASHWHEAARAAWLYSPEEQIFISYESATSVRTKALYILDNGLGGVSGWELTHDADATLLELASTVFEEELSE